MGDHRADIKIEMEFNGIKDKCDMSINYFPEDCCNMDRRVTDFFNGIYKRGMIKYNKMMQKRYDEEHRQEIEAKERADLERLKIKYESGLDGSRREK